jgi:hypothetical protein
MSDFAESPNGREWDEPDRPETAYSTIWGWENRKWSK